LDVECVQEPARVERARLGEQGVDAAAGEAGCAEERGRAPNLCRASAAQLDERGVVGVVGDGGRRRRRRRRGRVGAGLARAAGW
jgi:hypothetical protein